MIKLYGIAASRTGRSIWAIEELGLPYEIVTVDFRKSEHKDPKYLALNPYGRIPALSDGDVFMTESLAINLYIAQRYGTGKLWPAEEPARARVLQWTLWAATELEPVVYLMLREIGAKKPEARDPKIVAQVEQATPPLMQYLNQTLEQHQHLIGDAFTLADLQVACVLDYASPRSNYDLKPWPKVAAWHDACHARPAYQRLAALRAAVPPV